MSRGKTHICSLYRRDAYASVVYLYILLYGTVSVCLSVCLYVTSWCCVETVSQIELGFLAQKLSSTYSPLRMFLTQSGFFWNAVLNFKFCHILMPFPPKTCCELLVYKYVIIFAGTFTKVPQEQIVNFHRRKDMDTLGYLLSAMLLGLQRMKCH